MVETVEHPIEDTSTLLLNDPLGDETTILSRLVAQLMTDQFSPEDCKEWGPGVEE